MERGVTYRSLIEYFLLMQDAGKSNTLVYYDQKGTRFERPIERGQFDDALKKFDGKPKAVARSNGGLVRAVPYQLVLCEGYGNITPQPKIKVKFREFKRDSEGRVGGGTIQTVSKLVMPHEVVDLFTYRLDEPQRFIIDIGRGIVPIYIIKYASDIEGKSVALFVEMDDVERSMLGRGEKTSSKIKVYQISRDLLRYACHCNLHGQDEYNIAMENYQIQKQQGLEIFPESLAIAGPIEGPTNLTYQDFRKYITDELNQFSDLELTMEPTKLIEETERVERALVPFNEPFRRR